MVESKPNSILLILDGSESDPIEEFARVYFALREAGARLLITSEHGGYPWLRQRTPKRRRVAQVVERFLADRRAREEIADTLRLCDVFVEDFAGCVLIGGTTSSLQTSPSPAAALAAKFLAEGKPAAAVSSGTDFLPEGPLSGLALIASGGSGLPDAISTLLSAAQEIEQTEGNS